MDSFIELKQMKFFSFHGVAEQEKIVGNQFTVDLKIRVDLLSAAQSDKLEDTINYADLYELIKKEMQIPSLLLEHVAYRIQNQLTKNYPAIQGIKLTLRKLNPPISGEIESAGVILDTL